MSYLGLGANTRVSLGGFSVPRAFIRATIISAQIVCIVLAAIVCSKHYNDGLQVILFQVHVMLLFLSRLSIYVALVLETNEINGMLDYLQMVVDERTSSRHNIQLDNGVYSGSFRLSAFLGSI